MQILLTTNSELSFILSVFSLYLSFLRYHSPFYPFSIVCRNRQGQPLPTLHHSQAELEGATASAQAESFLLLGKYYFYPTGWKVTDDPYPITLTFADWQFPHGNVPESWKVFPGSKQCLFDLILPSSVRSFVICRDRSCQNHWVGEHL